MGISKSDRRLWQRMGRRERGWGVARCRRERLLLVEELEGRALLSVGLSAGLPGAGDPAASALAAVPAIRTDALIEVPDPLSGDNPHYPLVPEAVPAVGVPYADHYFGTTLTRVTQTEGFTSRHEYSRFDPFNVDQTRIILLGDDGGWRVFKTNAMPCNQPANLVLTLDDAEDPRWDPAEPNLLWGLRDFSILNINATSGEETVVKDFTNDPTIAPILRAHRGLYRITVQNEGESSADMRYWAFMLQDGAAGDYKERYVFCYDRQADQVLGVTALTGGEGDLNWVGMSPLGNYVVYGGEGAGGRFPGLTISNRAMSEFRSLADSWGHSDVGLDVHGNEVVVGQTVADGEDRIDMLQLSLQSPVRTPLVRLHYASDSPIGFGSGVHISGNASGWAVISTETPPNVPDQNWLDRTVTLVSLDAAQPRAWYLAKVTNTTQDYWEETHASIARDGRKVVWASNGGQNVGKDEVYLMQLDVPMTDVVPVNHAPSFTAADPPPVREDAGPQTVSGWVTGFSPGPPEDASQKVLQYLVTSVSNPQLFSSAPAVGVDGTLQYAIAPHVYGSATFQVAVEDDGGTANGGQDTSVPQTFQITVLDVAPSVTVQRAAGQAAASTGRVIHFTAVFSEPVAGFTTGDAKVSGTAGATRAVVTRRGRDGTTYDVAVRGMKRTGTVIVMVPAGVARERSGKTNLASTSADDGVWHYVPRVVRLDFGTAKSPVAKGYKRVTDMSTYKPSRGYGWTTGMIASADRGGLSPLDRDLNLTQRATFVVNVPNGWYQVNVRLGDLGGDAHDLMRISLEGASVDTVSAAAKEAVSRSYVVEISDGQLTIGLDDQGGDDPYVAIASLVVTAVPPASAKRG